jgi:hypothetical protein
MLLAIRVDSAVREHQLALLTAEHLRLDVAKKKFGCLLGLGNFARTADEVPRDLKRAFGSGSLIRAKQLTTPSVPPARLEVCPDWRFEHVKRRGRLILRVDRLDTYGGKSIQKIPLAIRFRDSGYAFSIPEDHVQLL